MTVFVDSNILLYAVDRNADGKRAIAHDILVRGQTTGLCMANQVLGEFLNVVRRKQPSDMAKAITLVEYWALLYPVTWTSTSHMLAGARLAERFRLQFWDAVILAVAIEQGGAVLLSEDMQNDAVIEGTRILNPFVEANTDTMRALFSA